MDSTERMTRIRADGDDRCSGQTHQAQLLHFRIGVCAVAGLW